MEIIKQKKEKSLREQVNEMSVGDIKNFDEMHKATVRGHIRKLTDREYITSSSVSDKGEPCLVVVRIK